MTLSKFQMTKPVLEKFNYLLKDNFNSDNLNNDAQCKIKTTYHDQTNNIKNEAVVGLELIINDENLPYIIEVFVSTKVIWESDVDNNTVESILNKTIPAHLVAHIRPIITVITSYSSYQSLNIPFLDFS